jgi:predicted MPP superfamily phosphohydrolase
MKITVFFISDIHLSDEKAENQGLVLDAFLEDFRKQKEQLNPEETYVLIGGDLVKDSDAEGIYQNFYERIVKPIMATGIKKRNIICVPGNHEAQRSWIKKNIVNYAPVVSQNFTEDKFDNYINQESGDFLLQKFLNYSNFMDHTMERDGFNLIGYPLELNDDWSVYCLNSALTSFTGVKDDDYPQLQKDDNRLNIDTRRLYEWVRNNKKKKILLMHHPFEFFSNWARVELNKIVKQNFDLVLTGHTHNQDLLCNNNGSESYIWCMAPQLFTDKKDTLGYSIIELNTEGVKRIIYREWNEKRNAFRPGVSFTEEEDGIVNTEQQKMSIKDKVTVLFEERLNDSMAVYGDKSLIWLDRYFSLERFDRAFSLKQEKLFSEDNILNEEPERIKIVTPAQYGLTSFAWHFLLRLWREKNKFGLFLDCALYKKGKPEKLFEKQLATFEKKPSDVRWIIFDNWKVSNKDSKEILNYTLNKYPGIPVMLLSSMLEKTLIEKEFTSNQEFGFANLFMAPLQTFQVRKMVEVYNQKMRIDENDKVLKRLNADITNFNMHRTPLSCISLLEVFNKSFDDNPVNRTAMIQRLLSIIFDNETVPNYKSLPDVKDCEFVLGYICEHIIRTEHYYFSDEEFFEASWQFCNAQKITLDYRYLFDILLNNQILCQYDTHLFSFRFAFWVYYFAAMRMTKSEEFAAFILDKENYAHYPEVMEFYTGSDRTRNDAAELLIKDIQNITQSVESKVGIPEDVNPFQRLKMKRNEEQIGNVIQQLEDNLQKTKLPDRIKDAWDDKNYNPSRPYHQDVYKVMKNYSVIYLQEIIEIASKAMRNSDYIRPELKESLFDAITKAWLAIVRVIYLMAPALARDGVAGYDGFSLQLEESFDNVEMSDEEKLITVIACIPLNIVSWYKDDIYSAKLANLMYNKISNPLNPIAKHLLVGIVISEQPEHWVDIVRKYLTDTDRNSYYFGDTLNMLTSKWQFGVMSDQDASATKRLLLAGYAKHYSGSNRLEYGNIRNINPKALPDREVKEDDN